MGFLFYFYLLKDSSNIPRKIYQLDEQGQKIKDKNYPREYRETPINLEHIINKKYYNQEVLVNLEQSNDIFTKVRNRAKDSFNSDKLGGEFGDIQTKEFLKRYYLLDYYPKDNSKGFHACLFKDRESKEYTLAIRGSFDIKDYVGADFWNLLVKSSISKNYFEKMILFYESCAKKYPEITKPKSLNVVGHSLGGCLAQPFALSFAAESHQDSIIKEVYTFNAPGVKNLKLYDIILSIPNTINESIQNYLLATYTKKLKDKAQELKINTHDLDTQINLTLKEIIYNTNNANTHFGISLSSRSGNPSVGLEYANITYEAIHYELSNAYQTLTHNYNNRNKESYKLSVSDRIFHIESQNKTDEKHHANESIKENATQHLGKDIEGNYFLLNLNFGGLDSHRITSMAKILYFYAYLYEVNESLIDTTSKEVKTEYELHKDEFLKEHNEIDTKEYRECKKALEYCNTIALAVHKILYKREVEKALKEARENGYYEVKSPPNWLYAIIEQRVFEAQIKTKEAKFLLEKDTSNIIEAILYLQEKGVYIQILKEYVIKGLEAESLLAYLFAIQESSFFVSVDKELNPLIQDSHTATSLIGYITARTQIFCNPNRKADELLIKCYKNETLALYPRATQGMA
ncbi:lipase family protein [Helicobacter bilis]|nr:hypothetical protein [Helicobacter bilis]